MNGDWWDLPGPRRFLESIEDDFRSGKSVILGLPKNGPPHLRRALRRSLGNNELLSWREIDLADSSDLANHPPRLLLTRFAGTSDLARVTDEADVASCQDLWRCVIWVEGFSDSAWDSWKAFIGRLDQILRNSNVFERPMFCFAVRGKPAGRFPVAKVTYESRFWRNRLRQLDMSLFISEQVNSVDLSRLQSSLTLAVATQLAGTDPGLALKLAGLDLEELLAPHELLHGLAADIGWHPDQNGGQPVWEDGSLDEFHGQPFVHSAFLALKGDPQREIDRRIWKGQIQVLFPFIEERRIELVRSMAHHFRLPFQTNYELIDDPLDLEISHVYYQLRKLPIPRLAKDLARTLRDIRHQLAHVEVVPLHLIERLEELLPRMDDY